jgi:hypothetical protein
MKLRIELLKPHVHQGGALPPGATLELDADLARWLIQEGVAKAKTDPSPSKPVRSETQASTNNQEKSP